MQLLHSQSLFFAFFASPIAVTYSIRSLPSHFDPSSATGTIAYHLITTVTIFILFPHTSSTQTTSKYLYCLTNLKLHFPKRSIFPLLIVASIILEVMPRWTALTET